MAEYKQTKLEPFWNAMIAGIVVALITLNVLPSPPIQYLYRIKAVATQTRLTALQQNLPKQNLPSLRGTHASGNPNQPNFCFLTADAVKLPAPKNKPVLSTNDSLPNRVFAQVTFLADRIYPQNEIQAKLEQTSLSRVDDSVVKEIERQIRVIDWQREAANHLVQQMDSKGADESSFQTVSTNLVGTKSLQTEWRTLVDQQNQLYVQLTEQLRVAKTKAAGFIAIAGRPQILPRIAKPLSNSMLVALLLGVITSALFFIVLSSRSPIVRETTNKPQSNTKERDKEKAVPIQPDRSGNVLAKQLSKIGIPFLGSLEPEGYVPLSTTKASVSSEQPHEIGLDTRSSTSQGASEVRDFFSSFSVPAQKATEWLLILWIAIAAFRFCTDDMWRILILQSPLTGLAKLLSGLA